MPEDILGYKYAITQKGWRHNKPPKRVHAFPAIGRFNARAVCTKNLEAPFTELTRDDLSCPECLRLVEGREKKARSV